MTINASFFNMNTHMNRSYSIPVIDEVPVASIPDAEDISRAFQNDGEITFIDEVSEIKADNIPAVDDGYYTIFEIREIWKRPDERDDITYKYIAYI